MATNNPDWIERARDEAILQWAYEGLIDDFKERCLEAAERGEDPKEFVQWLGEKYGLTPRSEWERGY
jgi:hypothetical protein